MFLSPGSRGRPGLLRLLSGLKTAGSILIGQGRGWPAIKAVSGDGALAATGALTVTKTAGAAFAASATTDTTNAANISSGILPATRLGPIHRGFDVPINLQLTATVAANALTIAVKDASTGNDASAANPVIFQVRSSGGASSNTSPGTNGAPVFVSVTSALSLTVPSGQTLGTANSVPFRFWIVGINNAGTIELAVINCVVGAASPTQIVALPNHNLISTAAISAAPSAGVYYSTTARASLAFSILGFVEFDAGQATAGTYATSPTSLQLFGPGIKKPGDIVQSTFARSTSQTDTTSSTFTSTAVAATITLSSTPNIVRFSTHGTLRNADTTATTFAVINMFRGATQCQGSVAIFAPNANGEIAPASINYLDAPGTTSATTYTVKLKSTDNVHTVSYPYTGVAGLDGTITLNEVMV